MRKSKTKKRQSSKKPLVTVNILSWNRKKDLRYILYELRKQTYSNIEIIVVDNASTDGSQEMVEKKFPEVKLINIPKNTGIEGWNWGFVNAKGKYIVVLDDDSYPEKDAIEKMVDVFKSHPSVGVVAFKIIHPSTGYVFTNSWSPKVTGFCGCGAGIRAKVLTKSGYYSEDNFLYFIERDLAIRIWEAGYSTVYRDDIIVYHKQAQVSRCPSKLEMFYAFRNGLWFLFRYFDVEYIFIGAIRESITYFVVTLQAKALTTWLRAILGAIAGLGKILPKRKRVSRPIQDFYYRKDVLFEPILLKIKRKVKRVPYEGTKRYKTA